MQIPGYSGICRCCFNPIKSGEETRLREDGLLFHRQCVESHPGNYYVKLERRRALELKNEGSGSDA